MPITKIVTDSRQHSRGRPRKRILLVVSAVLGIGLFAALAKLGPTPKEVDFDTEPTDIASMATAPFYNEASEANQRGYAWAKAKGMVTHAQCKTEISSAQSLGCSRFVTEQKHIPPTPTETDLLVAGSVAACAAVVQAYYDPLFQDIRERGLDRAVAVRMRRHMGPDLRTCSQIGKGRSFAVVHEPSERLAALIERVQRGQLISEGDVETVRIDYAGVQGASADAKQQSYLAMAEQLFQIAGGKARFVPDTSVRDEKVNARCTELRTKIDGVKLTYRQADSQVAKSAEAGSILADPHTARAAVRERQNSMDEWSELAGQSKALACP